MAVQFCEICKSLIVNGSCSNIQCHNPTGTVGQEKRRGWKIGTSFVDFWKPVTKEYQNWFGKVLGCWCPQKRCHGEVLELLRITGLEE